MPNAYSGSRSLPTEKPKIDDFFLIISPNVCRAFLSSLDSSATKSPNFVGKG